MPKSPKSGNNTGEKITGLARNQPTGSGGSSGDVGRGGKSRGSGKGRGNSRGRGHGHISDSPRVSDTGADPSQMQVEHPKECPKRQKDDRGDCSASTLSTITKPPPKN